MNINTDFLIESFKKIDINLSELQIDQFNNYYSLLVEKNKVMNLTGITEYNEVVIKHFIDSILSNKYFDYTQNCNIIDVGTGAGFPGIPLKIIYPNINITLLDSLNKRIQFLQQVVDENKLSNVICIHGRAEDFGHDQNYREKYDLCVSRAVANLSTLSEYCLPFIKKDGLFISYKAADIDEEVEQATNAIKRLSSKLENVQNREIPETDINRKFVCIRKTSLLNKKYPRKSGMPSREPLK